MTDIIGIALLDYFHGKHSEEIITETNISEPDELPISHFFRTFSEMPSIEKKALKLAKGKVLDVGAGAGSHALYLQQKGLKVTAIDSSEGAVKVCKLRGVSEVKQIELMRFKGHKFDTILLLMNGSGIFQKLEYISLYLEHLKSLLTKNGQILIDSSDLRYMYDSGEDGGIWIPGDAYYGELEFIMTYKGLESAPFDWLYLDERIFESACASSGLVFELIERGTNYDYLARITVRANSPS